MPGSRRPQRRDRPLRELIEQDLRSDRGAAERWARQAEQEDAKTAATINRLIFSLTWRDDPAPALRYGLRSFELSGDPKLGRQLADRHYARGELRKSLAMLERLGDRVPPGELAEHRDRVRFVAEHVQLLERGAGLRGDRSPSTSPRAERVVYLLNSSLPHFSNGYAVRSHGLALGLRAHGIDVAPLTRPGFPHSGPHPSQGVGEIDQVDGIAYRRLPANERAPVSGPPVTYLNEYADAATSLAGELGPAIIHAASNYANGVVGNAVARRLAIPSIYEVRGLWEITRASREPGWGRSERFEMEVRMEFEAAAGATRVIALTEALRAELVDRGLERDRVAVVPNGVDPDRFSPRPRDRRLEGELGLSGKTVVGYIGSAIDYEGLDDLLVAASRLEADRQRDLVVLIVGDGSALAGLRALTERLGLERLVRFTGRIPHREVESYHSLVDVFVCPRKPYRVCEMVSPLKPFEAMAMGTAVLASDVAALGEIITHDSTGLLFRKGDVDDLAGKLATLTGNAALRERLGRQGRSFVVREHSWSELAGRVVRLYRELGLRP